MLTSEQMAILDKYVSLVKIQKVYSLNSGSPITYSGKIVSISPIFAIPSKKTVTIDIPLGPSTKTEVTVPTTTTPSATTTTYTTQILRITIQLDENNISWLLENQNQLPDIATAFFQTVKENYLQTQTLPNTLEQFVNKTY